MATAAEPPSPRRAAPPRSARGTSAQTREKILDAAVAEFGAKGFAGARTAEIATRAGVNQQLIAYHFGGKQGLLDELRARWAATQSAAGPAATLAESVRRYLDLTLDQPDWSRLVVWRALGDTSDSPDSPDSSHSPDSPPDEQSERLRAAVERIRERQAEGEVAADLDPAFALLLCYALTFAPIALPHFVRDITGLDPLSAEYRERCAAEIVKLLTPRERPNP
ncbi:TetR/AcrR family transcriptional regulator [Catenulispora rubra]|uniref:TetR/AcrR family transcriptional regulator n=1 Tax=Catenulispora rubra TaxID=280293 RepID=UPI0018924045|nr:TetR/AcrR family transcriptional regulator [Catenulispora rubra]